MSPCWYINADDSDLKHFISAILYSWYKDDLNNFVRQDITTYIFISRDGKLYFSSVTKQDEGYYYCMVSSPQSRFTYGGGKQSMPIELIVTESSESCSSSGFPCVGVRLIYWSLLLAFSLHFPSSSAFLISLFTHSSHLNCGLPHFLEPSCFFVSALFGSLSSFIWTMSLSNILKLIKFHLVATHTPSQYFPQCTGQLK